VLLAFSLAVFRFLEVLDHDSGTAWRFSALTFAAGHRPLRYRPPYAKVRYIRSWTSVKLAVPQSQDTEPVTGLGALGSPVQGHKRNASLAGFDSSPASPSIDSPDQNAGDDSLGRKRPVKRACNECRQQKVGIFSPPDPSLHPGSYPASVMSHVLRNRSSQHNAPHHGQIIH
jgi:hypothetical protein